MTAIGCHSFRIYTVILLSLLSFAVEMTVPPRARYIRSMYMVLNVLDQSHETAPEQSFAIFGFMCIILVEAGAPQTD